LLFNRAEHDDFTYLHSTIVQGKRTGMWNARFLGVSAEWSDIFICFVWSKSCLLTNDLSETGRFEKNLEIFYRCSRVWAKGYGVLLPDGKI